MQLDAHAGGGDAERTETGGLGEVLPLVHTAISNFKRWVLDVFHGVSRKHLQSYLDKYCYRLNRRHARGDLFRRVLNRCCRNSGPVTYAQLTRPERVG